MWTVWKESRLLSDLKGFGVLGSRLEADMHLELRLSVLTGLQQLSHKMVMILQREGKVRRREEQDRQDENHLCAPE